jgi:hypothetical protein
VLSFLFSVALLLRVVASSPFPLLGLVASNVKSSLVLRILFLFGHLLLIYNSFWWLPKKIHFGGNFALVAKSYFLMK